MLELKMSHNSAPLAQVLCSDSFQGSLLRETESCYEREVVLHGETTNQLIKSRETAKTFDEQVVELRSQRQQAEANLSDVAARLAELESASKTELELLRSELEVVNKQNSALHEQLANLSHQLTTLNKSGADLDVSLGGNESSEQVRIIKIFFCFRRA